MKSDSLNKVVQSTDRSWDERAHSIEVISVSSILLLLGMALIIFAAFYLVKRYVLPYLNSRAAVKRFTIFVFRLEVLIWGIFALFALYQLLSGAFWITVAGIAVISAVGFSFLRNFFVGLFFRLENKFEVGDPVRFDGHTGTIEAIGASTILLKTEEEELVYLTYHGVYQESLVKRQAKGRLMSMRLSLSSEGRDLVSFPDQIKEWLYECPWAIVNERVQVQVQEDMATLTVYAVDTESLERIEEYLLKKMQD